MFNVSTSVMLFLYFLSNLLCPQLWKREYIVLLLSITIIQNVKYLGSGLGGRVVVNNAEVQLIFHYSSFVTRHYQWQSVYNHAF